MESDLGGAAMIKKDKFLSYSPENTFKLYTWVESAIASYISLAYLDGNESDNFAVEYDIECSMRQWAISRYESDYKSKSRWAVQKNNLIIDSALKDQHILTMRSNDNLIHTNLKIALPPSNTRSEKITLHSISAFDGYEILEDLSNTKATTQIRWLEIPGTKCGGAFFSTRDNSKIFIPIKSSQDDAFKKGDVYSEKSIFDFVSDNYSFLDNLPQNPANRED